MTHPTKEAKPLADSPDRDFSWTLDSLHGFCRKEGLEGYRHPSWSLGTFPDRWMYLNFIFHYFTHTMTTLTSGAVPVSAVTVVSSRFPSEVSAAKKASENSESGSVCVLLQRTKRVANRTWLT